jgi:putative oxidoreductase
MNTMNRVIDARPAVGLAVLRVVLGAIFVYHGFGKLFGGIESTAGFFGMIGIPAPVASAWLVGLLELFGGLALVAGFGARAAAALLVPVMLVAIATVHGANGFANVNITGMGEQGPVFGMPGWEFNLALVGGLLGVALGGAGSFRALLGGRGEEAPAARPTVRRAA